MKSGRTIFRAAILLSLGFIALALIASSALKAYGQRRLMQARTSYEKEVGSLNLQAYRLPAIPEEENAATWLTAGMSGLIFFKGEDQLIADAAAKPASDWTAEEESKIKAITDRNAAPLSLFVRAGACSRSNFDVDYTQEAPAKLPPLVSAIKAARLLRCKAALEFRRGAPEDSARSIESLGVLAAALEREPLPIALLIGAVVERLQLSAVQDLVQSPGAGPAILNRLMSSLLSVDIVDQYRRAMNVTGSTTVEAILGGKSPGTRSSQSLPWSIRQAPNLAAAQFLDLQRERSRSWGRPYPVAKAAEGGRLPYLVRHLQDDFAKDQTGTAVRITFMTANRRLAAISVRLRLRLLESGSYPPDLTHLPGALDPDPFTGKPLTYRVNADGSAEIGSFEAPALLREFVPERNVSAYIAGCRWLLPAPARNPH